MHKVAGGGQLWASVVGVPAQQAGRSSRPAAAPRAPLHPFFFFCCSAAQQCSAVALPVAGLPPWQSSDSGAAVERTQQPPRCPRSCPWTASTSSRACTTARRTRTHGGRRRSGGSTRSTMCCSPGQRGPCSCLPAILKEPARSAAALAQPSQHARLAPHPTLTPSHNT